MTRKVDYLPWTGQPFSYEKHPEQKEWHDHLRAHCGAEIDPSRLISRARFFERDMRSKRAGVGGVIEREHGGPKMKGRSSPAL